MKNKLKVLSVVLNLMSLDFFIANLIIPAGIFMVIGCLFLLLGSITLVIGTSDAWTDEILEGIPPRWIPVTERLPEKEGYYFATTQIGETAMVHRLLFHSGCWPGVDADVTAWMLMQPYKEDTE